ncbi:hypothetical protein CCACVL1_25303 [Corchorus capsularis]|uniref:Uncharacterized protein n=1 Tax=Corchorus capsularis TaxID=210143 RepID=A0A1R3GLG5_COCAP|nr:hypothetical protein CCACVL1_25303 [Corchorus capsularis]
MEGEIRAAQLTKPLGAMAAVAAP